MTLSLIVVALLVVGVTLLFLFGAPKKPRKDNGKLPPYLSGIPVLGTMLQYNKDPKKFVTENGKKFGVFMIDLAGRDAVVLSDRMALQQFYNAPESKLSAVAAMRELNFDALLGDDNIDRGTYIHRKILVRDLRSNVLETLLANFRTSCLTALPTVFTGTEGQADLFPSMRRVFMRCIIDTFIGSEVLDEYPEFSREYYEWHDKMEEAAALSVISPRFLARPLIYHTIAKSRQAIMDRLQKSIQKIWDRKTSYYIEEVKAVDSNATVQQATAYSIGILFAAHKNPAIASAQTLTLLLENVSAFDRVLQEIHQFLTTHRLQDVTVDQLQQELPLLRAAVMETLRLTPHALGPVRVVRDEPFRFTTSSGAEYEVPVGSLIMTAPLSVSIDDKMFKDADSFDLDRFLEPRREDAKHVLSAVPFSAGTHGCPGRPFALLMIQYSLLALLSKIDVRASLPLPPLDFHKATLGQRSASIFINWSLRK